MQESARRQEEEERGRRKCKGNGETIGHANDEADPTKKIICKETGWEVKKTINKNKKPWAMEYCKQQ